MALTVNLKDISTTLRREFEPLTGRQVARCAAAAINKVLQKDRAMIGREIRSIYNMGVFDAKSETVQKNATTYKLEGSIWGNAGFTPFEYFKVSGESSITGNDFKLKRASRYAIINGKRKVVGKTTTSTGSGRHSTFTVSITKGSSSLFTHAFLANTKNGPMLFNRGTYDWRTNIFGSISERNPMARLRTLSVYQEMTNRKVMGKSEALLREEYAKEYYRLLTLSLSTRSWK